MLLSISGFSAAGKTHVVSSLPEMEFGMTVSHTTRQMRQGELPGFDYHFVTEQEFIALDSKRVFLETDLFAGYWYGVLHAEIDQALSRAACAVHVCTPSGADVLREESVRRHLPFCSVFIKAPIDTIFFRMIRRWASNPKMDIEYLAMRMASTIVLEQRWMGSFNLVIQNSINPNPDDVSLSQLLEILRSIAAGETAIPAPVHVTSVVDHCRTVSQLQEQIANHMRQFNIPKTLDDASIISNKIAELCA